MIDHENMTYSGATKYLPQSLQFDFDRQVLDLIESGNFWQDAQRYVGPLPAPGDVGGWTLLRKSFAPILKLRECLNRHVRGVIGREPQFEAMLDGAQPLADAADSATGAAWYNEQEHKLARAIVTRLLSTGSAFIRYDVPPGLVSEGVDRNTGEPTMGVSAADWQAGYALTYLELCPRGTASITTDSLTKKKTSFYSYVEESESGQKTKCIQVSWLDADKITRVRVVKSNAPADEWAVDCGGNLLVLEANIERMITPDLLRLQDIVCSIATMVKVNTDVAGYPQTDAIDIAKPSIRVAAPTTENPNATRLEAVPMASGPRSMRAWYSEVARDNDGNVITADDGKPIMRSGSVQYRDPVSSQPLRDDIDMFNNEIYTACNQRHIAQQSRGNTSAEYLIEMRADYADSLLETQPDLERLLSNAFKARLCMAAFLAGDGEALETFKAGYVRVALMLNAGPISGGQAQEILARVAAGLLSKETAMILLGIDDPDAELDKIKAQVATETPEELSL